MAALATSASLGGPRGVAVDATGNLYIADSGNNRIRAVLSGPPPPPQINAGGVVSAASFLSGPVCAGSLVSIFGTNLALGTGGATKLPLPTNINGTEVRISGFSAPLVFVSPTQINAQVPWEVSGGQSLTVQVVVNGRASNTVTISSASVCGGVFTTGGSDKGQGAILIAGTGEVAAPLGRFQEGAGRAVRPGELISIYATGLGPVTNPPPSGSPASGNPLSQVIVPVLVNIGGVPVEVTFAGLSPGFVGLYQINVKVPEGTPTGDAVQVVISSGGVSWNIVTIALLPQNTAELLVFRLAFPSGIAGGGTVTSSPSGINCGIMFFTCKATYAIGTVVTLTATPASGWTFSRWERACLGTTGPSCVLTMQPDIRSLFGDKLVEPVFTEAPATLTGTWSGPQKFSTELCGVVTFTYTWKLTQSGNSVTGTYSYVITIQDPSCYVVGGANMKNGSIVQGTVSGTSLTLVMDDGSQFAGTFTATTITITSIRFSDGTSGPSFSLTKQ